MSLQGTRSEAYFLVHTTHHTRPYITNVGFIAQDFRKWECRVDSHPRDSPYVNEIRWREKAIYGTEKRISLVEIWAKETLRRRREQNARGYQLQNVQPALSQPRRSDASEAPATQPTATSPGQVDEASSASASLEELRYERMSSLVQDLYEGLASFGECGCELPKKFVEEADRLDPDTAGLRHKLFPQPTAPSQLGLVCRYSRLLYALRYTSNATLPDWRNPDIVFADKITMEFNSNAALKLEHFVHAVDKAIVKHPGRMGRVERCFNGVFKVVMFVDVGELVLPSNDGGEDVLDPVPTYARGEEPPPYAVA
jgi:hypothetical protein